MNHEDLKNAIHVISPHLDISAALDAAIKAVDAAPHDPETQYTLVSAALAVLPSFDVFQLEQMDVPSLKGILGIGGPVSRAGLMELVYAAYDDLGMDHIELMPDTQLENLIDAVLRSRELPSKPEDAKSTDHPKPVLGKRHPVNRNALEKSVLAVYTDLNMRDVERMETEKLEWLLESKQGKWMLPAPNQNAPRKPRKPRKPKERSTVWEKINSGFEVRNGAVVHVEKWRISNRFGESMREHTQPCGDRVAFEGRMVATSLLRHFLETGQWVKRVPRPCNAKTYRAQVRVGSRVVYLGYFATLEDRDAAVFAYRMGVSPNGSKSA